MKSKVEETNKAHIFLKIGLAIMALAGLLNHLK